MQMRLWSHVFLFGFFILLACQKQQQTRQSLRADSLQQNLEATDSVTSKRRIDLLLAKADGFKNKKENDSAIYYYRKVEPMIQNYSLDTATRIDFLKSMGDVSYGKNEYIAADGYFEKAKALAERTRTNPALFIAINMSLAATKIETTDYTTARSLLQYAQVLIKENRPDDVRLLGRCQALFASIYYYNKDYERAIERWSEAASLYIKAGLDPDLYYFNMAHAYIELKQYKEALQNIGKAITIVVKRDGPNSKQVSDQYLIKGTCYRELGKYDSAEFYLRKSAQIRRMIFGEKNVNTFGAAYTLGMFFEHVEQFDSAGKYFHRSMISLIRNFDSNDERINPKPETAECNTDLFRALEGKARIVKQMAERTPLGLGQLSISLNTHLLADSVLNVYRRNAVYDDSQQALKEQYQIPYESLLDITHTLYQQSRDSSYLNIALRIMESSRAALLKDALQRAEAFGLTSLPPELRQKENELIRRRAGLLALMERQVSQRVIDSIGQELITVNNESHALQEEIRIISPNYLRVKYADPVSSIASLRDKLKDKDAVYMEYLWGEHSIYLLVVAKDELELNRIARDDTFNQAFRTFLSEVDMHQDHLTERVHFLNYCRSAFFLYRHLVGQSMNGRSVSHLMISGDDQFASFPFEALVTEMPDTTEVDYRLSYLVRQCAVSYVYSSGLMSYYAKDKVLGTKLIAFGYGGKGDPSLHRDNEAMDLPGTREEIEAIKKVMDNRSNKFYMEQDASEHQFKDQIRNFNIVHLAVHGVADTANVLQSRLIFRSENDSLEDGKLYAHELYDLNLEQLNLAVLSACESGIGMQQTGEGMMSMARGFTYAGCPSLIISLWKIDDRKAALVMGRLYYYLSEGKDKDQSLARAKLDYLAQANEFNAHPRYWAAFMQVGDTTAIQSDTTWRLIVVIGASGLLFLFFLMRLAFRARH